MPNVSKGWLAEVRRTAPRMQTCASGLEMPFSPPPVVGSFTASLYGDSLFIERRIFCLRLISCVLGMVALSVPAIAETPTPEAHLFTGGDTLFRAAPQEFDAHVELSAKRGKPLLTRTLTPLRSVAISSDTSVRMPIGRQNLSAGTVLFAAGNPAKGIFCAPGRGGDTLGVYFACLVDSDGDGRFERQAWGGGARSRDEQVFGPTDRGGMEPFGLSGNGTALPVPVAYQSVEIERGTKTAVDIVWRAKRTRNSSTYRVEIRTDGGEHGRGISASAQEILVSNTGEQSVMIDGVYLIVNGVLEDGSISYRISGINHEHNITYGRFSPGTTLTLYL
ncbi:hypothetical protein D3C72_1190930 [compost metagenome]